ncbi:hypothetical protein L1987_47031 [Smallanthus sonchifolius]|uniref:Uncharacterized protein n=1 Tax=Smallanthus sonchifolius TaxID=185202 RepID=A0ACB9G1A3_9ASTR|nr:hypothetical protein L1987_47031 [Smallanthus sonchifolius]
MRLNRIRSTQSHGYGLFSWSMQSVIQRYNRTKDGDNQLLTSMSEVQFWQMEAEVLRQQLETLQETHRQVMGKELRNMGVLDLEKLENQLQMSLQGIRLKKEEILINEIQDLTRKGSLIHQQNIELYKTVPIPQIYGASAENCVIQETDGRGLMNLQISQLPEHQTHGIPTVDYSMSMDNIELESLMKMMKMP